MGPNVVTMVVAAAVEPALRTGIAWMERVNSFAKQIASENSVDLTDAAVSVGPVLLAKIAPPNSNVRQRGANLSAVTRNVEITGVAVFAEFVSVTAIVMMDFA